MSIGVCRVVLHLPSNHSLKGKRRVLHSLVGRVRSRFNVSVVQLPSGDQWQTAALGICCVASNGRLANQILSQVLEFIQYNEGEYQVEDHQLEVTPGF